MKKLSLLIALCMLISIGGVYANWVYMEGVAGIAHDHVGSFGLSSATNTGSKGSIAVDGKNAHLAIDQAGEDYKAKLTPSGYFLVVFTPDAKWLAANPDAQEFWVTWVLETTNKTPTEHKVRCDKGQATLFTKFDTTTVGELKLVKDLVTGNFTAQLDTSELASRLELGEFYLSDFATYSNCSADIGQFGNIGITVSEKVITGSSN